MTWRGAWLAALLMVFGTAAQADDGHDHQVVCTVGGCKEINIPKPRYSDANAFSVQQVWSVVDTILSVSGLLPNFQVVETHEVGNAAAVVIDGERYLAFNPDWIAQYKSDPNAQWQLYGVMAHEVGHHLQGHTITGTGSRPPTELEADEYAGFILAALGASVSEAQSLWATLSEEGSATHPPRHQRLAAVERGWLRRKGQVSEPVRPVVQPPQPASPPPPAWAMRHCVSTYAANRPAQLCFSSVLSPQGTNSYGPANAQDGNGSTAWVEGVSGQGIGEGFVVVFSEPVLLSEFSLRNGYTKSDRTFTRNSRVRSLQASTSSGVTKRVSLQDSSNWQSVQNMQSWGPVEWIAFRIDDVFAGTHYQDTAITELSFK
ncbi:NADase-type glycan-binding domain-containing protein [Aestuariivita boseongensis]|uniref:NADase-type glycan-binding domain-containing protein n=1 Tax=Aestuariivita boseongensis TaxID=1470562 RepID=UPI000680D13A|nr:hypothetical protein [Aestuariivita boseongensis]